jgi:threonylcarbamoyladenosine tRNA methylthiotransferase MtaB
LALTVNRPSSRRNGRKVATLVISSLDRPALTTDILVGFPGETEADFEQTLSLTKEVGFAKMHVFPFSPRQRRTMNDLILDRP